MIPVKQTVFSNPATGKLGNCFVVCLASLLELRLGKIPRFHLMKSGWDKRLKEVLAKHGCKIHGYRYGKPCGVGVDGFFIVSFIVVDHPPYRHCMIMKNGKIVHNPRDMHVKLTAREMCYHDIRRVS